MADFTDDESFEWVKRPPFRALAHAIELEETTFKEMRLWHESHEVGALVQVSPNSRSALIFADMATPVPTDRWEPKIADVLHNYRVVLDRLPMNRFGPPDDVAGAAVFLASDASAYGTGQLLMVDAGGPPVE